MVSPASEATNSSVTWVRCIAVVKNLYTIVYDYFKTPDKHDYEILFHLPPLKIEIDQTNKSLYANSSSPMAFVPGDAAMFDKLSMDNGYVSMNGNDTVAPVVSYHASGANVQSDIIIAPINKNTSEIKIKQKISNDGLGLIIETESGEKDMVIFRKSGATSASFWGNTGS